MTETHSFAARLAGLRPALIAALGLILVGLVAVKTTVGAGLDPSANMAPIEVSPPLVLERSLWSPALGKAMSYDVYLPPGYDSDVERRYPVLYMLHGLGLDQDAWENTGLFSAATEMIESGEIEPMIIVTPNGERGYWVDHANNGPRFGTYVSKDLVSTVDAEYRTVPNRLMRAIGGMSMGGHGALQLALNNPAEFGIVGAHSVALRTFQQAFPFFGDKQYFETKDPVSISARNPVLASLFVMWIDIGQKDGWYGPAESYHRLLQKSSVPHKWRVFSGDHDDAYWRAHLADYLRFYSESFGVSSAVSLPPIEG